MTSTITDLASRKGKACGLCDEKHPIQNRCRFEKMATKISRLMEANALIPQIISGNKEAVSLADYYQRLLKKADEAHTILMDTLAGHGEIGEQIKVEYLEKLNQWANPITSPVTSETESPSSQKNSTPSETEDKPSISQDPGAPFPLNS